MVKTTFTKPGRPEWACRIRELMEFQGRNQKWLANQLGENYFRLNFMLDGQRHQDEVPALKEPIAKFLGVPASWIFGEESQSK